MRPRAAAARLLPGHTLARTVPEHVTAHAPRPIHIARTRTRPASRGGTGPHPCGSIDWFRSDTGQVRELLVATVPAAPARHHRRGEGLPARPSPVPDHRAAARVARRLTCGRRAASRPRAQETVGDWRGRTRKASATTRLLALTPQAHAHPNGCLAAPRGDETALEHLTAF